MPNFQRQWVPGNTFFFTVALQDRNSHLLVEQIGALRTALSLVNHRHPFGIDAWVVLPDHIHAIWTLPPGDRNYAMRWKRIKTLFSRAISLQESSSASRLWKGEHGIWQRRYWSHSVRDLSEYRRCFDYIHLNPLRHGLVTQVKDWPYSTFHRHVEKGVYKPDWCGGKMIEGTFGERSAG
jgi:putative transposase